MRTLLKNGRILDPKNNIDKIGDILIENDKIVKASDKIEEDTDEVIDATGKYVMPGLIDLHVHFRDPGLTYKETIKTGCEAAINGGFTSVFAMPNTKPVCDNAEIVRYVQEEGEKYGINVYQVGSITKGMKGEELSDIDGMVKAGCIALSEDGKSVMNSAVYRKAMKKAVELNIPILAHCEDINLVEGGVMNLDENSMRLGMKGISNAVEDIIVARDILLAKETGATLHLCHCSTEDSVKMVEAAKAEGVKVTAEVCPHHFTLTSDDIKKDDANFKMNPPLRTKNDVEALKNGLHNNIMDIISTDHAPHSKEEKEKSIKDAPFGIVGLETSVALTYTYLVKTGILTPLQMAEKMSYNPARVAGLNVGHLSVGAVADIVVIDPEKEYTIDTKDFKSMGRNTPFNGWKVFGEVVLTVAKGKILKNTGETK
ncbi:MAG: dihydroorotase [Lachnospiraceae bacterium]|nr:dihydroorotase [Lachnospiraceae bacterium]